MRGISWLVQELARSEEGLCDMALYPLSADLLQTTVVHRCIHITWLHALSTILYRYFHWTAALQSDTITHHYSLSLPAQGQNISDSKHQLSILRTSVYSYNLTPPYTLMTFTGTPLPLPLWFLQYIRIMILKQRSDIVWGQKWSFTYHLKHSFSIFVRPRSGKFFFSQDEGPVPTNLLVNTFPIFFKFIH